MPPTPADLPTPPAGEPVPPDLLAWARQTFDADEFLQQVRQIESTGGCTFESFIDQLDARAGVS
ncbi:MAG: hypothetical protein U0804_07840 [Gemmataceae bacterium]